MPTATELFLVRHGEAFCNRNQIVGGVRGCTGLTDVGRQQTVQLGELLLRHHIERPFDVIYTSPLPRARETAHVIASVLRLAPNEHHDLREPDYGTADGQPWHKVVAEFGGVPALEPQRPVAPGAEPWAYYLRRATRALDQLLTRHNGQRVLVIGHRETIDASFRLLLKLTSKSSGLAGFAAGHGGLTHWAQHPVSPTHPDAGWRWTLCAHNATPPTALTEEIAGNERAASQSEGNAHEQSIISPA